MKAYVSADLLVAYFMAVALEREKRGDETYLNDCVWIYGGILAVSWVQISLESHADSVSYVSCKTRYGRHQALDVVCLDGAVLVQIAVNESDWSCSIGRIGYQ